MKEHDFKLVKTHIELIKFSDEASKSNYIPGNPQRTSEFEILGINVIVSTNPIITDLTQILLNRLKEMPYSYKSMYEKNRILSLVHNIGAVRTQGRNKLKKILFKAEILEPKETQTIDLIPSSQMKEYLKIGSETSLVLNADGSISAKIPDDISSVFSDDFYSIHGDIKLQLSNNISFFGKIDYTLKNPIIQSKGITTNSATWVLHPNGRTNRLLGDNLLIQIVSIPKKTKELKLKVSGFVKVADGIWYRPVEDFIDYSEKITLQ